MCSIHNITRGHALALASARARARARTALPAPSLPGLNPFADG